MDEYSAEITQQFLDNYKKLEYIENYDRARFEKIRRTDVQLFDTLRHIRNCLTHTPKKFDNFPFHVSKFTLETLNAAISRIMLKTIEVGTKRENIKVVDENMDIFEAIKFMDDNNISSMPMFDEKGCIKYVVSNRAILSILAHLDDIKEGSSKVKDYSEFFALRANKDVYFGFMASDDYAFDAKQVFVGYNGEHKSCHLIFVTENGRADEPVLAIITPRDVYDC